MPLGIALVFAMLLAYLISHCPMLQVTAQPGFVSIDCGGSSGTYTDPETRLTWISDSNGFGLETVSRSATVSFPAQYPWLSSMRFFEGTQSKYCYEFGESNGIEQSNPYLVRASFWIGDKPPFSTPNKEHIRFLLLINADEWDSIDISLPQKEPLVMEMVVVAVVPVLSVCVVGRGETAFISSLELRPLSKNLSSVKSFMQTPLQENAAPRAMFRYARLDFGSTKDVRYPDDVYDRIWSENTQDYIHSFAPHPQATTNTFYSIHGGEETPSVVLQTAVVDNSSFNVTFHGFTRNYDFSYIIFYAEIADNVTKDERFFNQETITGSGVMSHISNIAMATGESIAYYNQVLLEVEEDGFLTFSFERNSTSSLGPLVNALELLYSSKDPLSLKTYNDDGWPTYHLLLLCTSAWYPTYPLSNSNLISMRLAAVLAKFKASLYLKFHIMLSWICGGNAVIFCLNIFSLLRNKTQAVARKPSTSTSSTSTTRYPPCGICKKTNHLMKNCYYKNQANLVDEAEGAEEIAATALVIQDEDDEYAL